MSIFSEKYHLPKRSNFTWLADDKFQAHFRDIVQNAWVAPSAALLFVHEFLRQYNQQPYHLTLAGGALRDAYVALKCLNYVAADEGFFTYNFWEIFWDFMHYWVKDYDVWVHINLQQKSEHRDSEKNSQLLEAYRKSIYDSNIPFTQSMKIAHENIYNYLYTDCPSLQKHIKKISKYFDPLNYTPTAFSGFGKLHQFDEYHRFFPESICYLLDIDIPSPHLFDEQYIGQYVPQNSRFLPNTPIPMSIQIMVTTKTPTELLASFDWCINRFGWTIDPFTNSEKTLLNYDPEKWYVPKSPFRFQRDAVPNVNPFKSLTRLANLAAKYSVVPLEIQRKYPKIYWKKILRKMHNCEGIHFQLSEQFLYEIVCHKLFSNDNNR